MNMRTVCPGYTILRLRYQSYNIYLEVHFGLVLAEGGHTGEQGFALDPGLGKHQKQCTDQSQVTEQELKVPQDTVSDRLKRKIL